MMRELDELDDVWALLEERADAYPLPDLAARRPAAVADVDLSVPRGGRPWTGRRRTGLAAAASLAVAATAVIGWPVASSRTTTAPHPSRPVSVGAPKPPKVTWTTLPDNGHYLFVFDRMPGTRVTSLIGVGNPIDPGGNPTYQEVQTTGPDGPLVFKINTTGSWQPDGGTLTNAAGHRAYYGSFLLHPEIPRHPVPPRWALAWEYATDSWVTVAGTGPTPIPLATAQGIAARLQLGTGAPIPNPPPG